MKYRFDFSVRDGVEIQSSLSSLSEHRIRGEHTSSRLVLKGTAKLPHTPLLAARCHIVSMRGVDTGVLPSYKSLGTCPTEVRLSLSIDTVLLLTTLIGLDDHEGGNDYTGVTNAR